MVVTLAQVIAGSKSDAILGISDRVKIIDFIQRALEIASYKSTYNPWLATLDVCSDVCQMVTLPSFVGTVLQVNVGGRPTIFRNDWYEWHINGAGSHCGQSCGFSNDLGWSPVFQNLENWSVVGAICEDATDGNGSLKMIVEGETMDSNQNVKQAITIPAVGPSTTGVQIPLVYTWANTDPALTYFKKITRITKPVTRGYVKLIAFPIRQMAHAVTLGYYAPNETNPTYRRIKVGAACKWVRIRYRRATLALVNDWDVVPISSYQAMLDLLKSIRLSDSNNVDASEAYLGKAVRLLNEIQTIESGSTYTPIQIEPGFGVGTIAYR